MSDLSQFTDQILTTMNPLPLPTATPNQKRLRIHYLALLVILCLPFLLVVGILGYFRLGSDTKALRQSFINNTAGQWHTKVNVHVGFFTTAAIRLMSQFVSLPAEPRAVISSLRSAEVGAYELEGPGTRSDTTAILKSADKTMTPRGWQRAVTVVSNEGLVVIYVPDDERSPQHVGCCLAVLKDQKLVVVSCEGNIEPLMQLAASRLGNKLHIPAITGRATDKNAVAYFHPGH